MDYLNYQTSGGLQERLVKVVELTSTSHGPSPSKPSPKKNCSLKTTLFANLLDCLVLYLDIINEDIVLVCALRGVYLTDIPSRVQITWEYVTTFLHLHLISAVLVYEHILLWMAVKYSANVNLYLDIK